MGINHKFLALVAGLILLSGIGLQADFTPFWVDYNFTYGARGLGMGNAFVAVADDLTAVALNPAGLAFMNYPRFDVSYRTGSREYDFLAHEYSTGSNREMDISLREFNFFSLAAPAMILDMRMHFALGYYRYIPYSQKGEQYSDVAPYTFTGKDGLDVLGFSASVILLKGFSFGITLQQFINNGTRIYDYHGNGSAVNVDINHNLSGRNLVLGLMARPMEDLSFAVSYQTRMSGTFDSQVVTTGDGEVQTQEILDAYINIPARLSFGMAARLVPAVNLSYEFSRIMWSKATLEDLPYPTGGSYFGGQSDIVNHRLGVEGKFFLGRVETFVRTGLSWERQLFRSADDANVTLKGISLGLGARFSHRVSVDMGYMYQRGKWQEFSDPEKFFPGDATFKNHVIAVSMSYTFVPKVRKKPSFFNPGRK